MILAGTISSVHLGSSFPFAFSQILNIRPVGNILVGVLLFLLSAGVAIAASVVVALRRRISADLVPLSSAKVRHVLQALNKTFGLTAVAVVSGGMRDRNMFAMKVGRHAVIAVGRGALPIVKQAEIFRFRVAHEYAHLAANDYRREQWLFAVYLATIVLLLVSYASSLTETLKILADNYINIGLSEVWGALFGWMRFGLVANLILYASIILMLLLERSSASRLREFYADSAAAAAVGPVAEAFPRSASTRLYGRWHKRLFMGHPTSIERANTVADPAQAHRADLILFLLQGYFVAFIVEVVLQLLFTAASPTLATHADRRDSLLRYFEIGSISTSCIIVVGALLGCAALFLTVSRLNVSLTFVDKRRARFALMVKVPIFVIAGMLLMLTTSQSTAWDLKQTDWNLVTYVLVAWDRLLVHGLLIFSTCIVIGVVLSVRPKTTGPLLSLSAIPMATTALAGYFLYH